MTARSKFPRPETLVAILPSAGIKPETWTEHRYAETLECIVTGPGGGDAYEFMFECMETGVRRRWGTSDRRSHTIIEELN